MITSGIVSYEDGRKAPEEFAPARKVRVELHFAFEPGVETIDDRLTSIAEMARKKVYELLGISAPVGAAPVATPVAPAAPRTRAKKAEPLPPVASFSDPLSGALENPQAGAKTSGETLFPEDVSNDPVPQKVVLSDKAMYDAVLAVNARISKPAEIVAIVAKYCPQDGVPPSLKRVPEDKRENCLKEIQEFAATVQPKK